MADAPVVHMGENSPEHVAFKLMHIVADVENRKLFSTQKDTPADRKWLLDTYAECLQAVRHPQYRTGG